MGNQYLRVLDDKQLHERAPTATVAAHVSAAVAPVEPLRAPTAAGPDTPATRLLLLLGPARVRRDASLQRKSDQLDRHGTREA